MEYLLGIIALVTGGMFFYRSKARSAEALNENIETKEQIIKEDQKIAENNGRIDALKENVNAVQDSADKELKKDQTNEELAKFLADFANRNKKS